MRWLRNYVRRIVLEVLVERGLIPDWRAAVDQQAAIDAEMDARGIYYDLR